MKFPWPLMKKLRLPRRKFSQNQSDRGQSWDFTTRKLAFNLSGYNKYGLYTHDVILMYDHPVVREALRRLPLDVLDARNFRLIRASQLSFLKIYLPKEKWVTYEKDIEYRYLTPYIEEINSELNERFEFGCYNYKASDWPADDIK